MQLAKIIQQRHFERVEMLKTLAAEASNSGDFTELSGDAVIRYGELVVEACIAAIEASQPPETTPWDCVDSIRRKFKLTNNELSKCPQCGGDADNGHDRCVPASAYMCKKCAAKEQSERAAATTHNAAVSRPRAEASETPPPPPRSA